MSPSLESFKRILVKVQDDNNEEEDTVDKMFVCLRYPGCSHLLVSKCFTKGGYAFLFQLLYQREEPPIDRRLN